MMKKNIDFLTHLQEKLPLSPNSHASILIAIFSLI